MVHLKTFIMKTNKKPATTKLLIYFDNELKALLTEDLKAFKTKSQFIPCNNQAAAQQAA
jgi:hypothetical protein